MKSAVEEVELLLLEALAELQPEGGEAGVVLQVLEEIRFGLSPLGHEVHHTGDASQWRGRVNWAKTKLVRDGQVHVNDEMEWTITRLGRARLARASAHAALTNVSVFACPYCGAVTQRNPRQFLKCWRCRSFSYIRSDSFFDHTLATWRQCKVVDYFAKLETALSGRSVAVVTRMRDQVHAARSDWVSIIGILDRGTSDIETLDRTTELAPPARAIGHWWMFELAKVSAALRTGHDIALAIRASDATLDLLWKEYLQSADARDRAPEDPRLHENSPRVVIGTCRNACRACVDLAKSLRDQTLSQMMALRPLPHMHCREDVCRCRYMRM